MGRDGIASWTMAVDAPSTPWGPARRGFRFEHVFHQVRHPLDVAASVSTFKEASWQYVYDHSTARADEPLILRAAKYWLEWNEYAEAVATWRFRIEDIAVVFDELALHLGITADARELRRLARDVNTRSRGRLFHYYDAGFARLGVSRPRPVDALLGRRGNSVPSVTWDDIERLDSRLCDSVRTKARLYGYEH
jgi:hypothetical protein